MAQFRDYQIKDDSRITGLEVSWLLVVSRSWFVELNYEPKYIRQQRTTNNEQLTKICWEKASDAGQ